MKHVIYICLFVVGFLYLSTNAVYATGGAPFNNPMTGQLHTFVAGNYTDLGVNMNGTMPDNVQDVRRNAAAELDNLKNKGVSHVRIWAFRGYNPDEFGKMANRVAGLAIEAANRQMMLTVDLFDSASNNTYQNLINNEAWINNMINQVLAPNAGASNIYWSLGNEIGGWQNPLLFATFYENKVAQMRAAGASHISFQPVPGSLNHNWNGGTTEQAARRCIAVSDDVSPHFYAKGAVQDENSVNWLEFGSLQQYINIAHELCKPTIIGEFGITGYCSEGYSKRTPENVRGWLDYFDKTLKVDQVSFWQFLKRTTGHLDDQCFADIPSASCVGNGPHLNAMTGYLGNPPSFPGDCGGVGNQCPVNINVAANHTSSGTVEASNTITSNKTVSANVNVKYNAGKLVHLKPNFHAQRGSTFHAYIDGCTTFSKQEEDIPYSDNIQLRNYPNPFTGQTTIEFVLLEDSPVTLYVSDVMGKTVEVLLNNEEKLSGVNIITFDGSRYSAGMYYYSIQAGAYSGTQKMLIVK